MDGLYTSVIYEQWRGQQGRPLGLETHSEYSGRKERSEDWHMAWYRFSVFRLLTTCIVGGVILLSQTSKSLSQESEPISPIQPGAPGDQRLIDLGRRLFFDKRVSFNNSVSCSSCHMFNKGGADGTSHSINAEGQEAPVNTPTIFNASLNFRYNWDGKWDTQEAQTNGLFTLHSVLNNTWPNFLGVMSKDKDIAGAFRDVFPNGLTQANVVEAIDTFERSLVTPDARFDDYLRGNRTAITADEAKGYALFKDYGCISCHQGTNVGGNLFQVLGVVGERGEYFIKRGHVTTADLGRFNTTGLDEDKYVFRVPSLRNVAMTAPYLHDGSAATLDDVVGIMFKYQIGREPQGDDVSLIVQFLKTLTGKYRGKLLSDIAPGEFDLPQPALVQ